MDSLSEAAAGWQGQLTKLGGNGQADDPRGKGHRAGLLRATGISFRLTRPKLELYHSRDGASQTLQGSLGVSPHRKEKRTGC